MSEDCARCGASPAVGFAMVNDRRYCHGDDDSEPTCYMQAQWGPELHSLDDVIRELGADLDTPSYGETMAAAHHEMVRWRTTLDWLADH